MRSIKYIDFGVQTLLIASGLWMALGMAVASTSVLELLGVQALLGPWQVLGCLVWVISERGDLRRRRIYLLWVVVYMCSLAILHKLEFYPEIKPIVPYYLTIPAWTLAIIYYRITWTEIFPKTKGRGKFLPNLSF